MLLVNRGRFSPGFIGQSHSQILRRTLRTYRDNIAYNTLPYNFSPMLLLPRLGDYAHGRVKDLREDHGRSPNVPRRVLSGTWLPALKVGRQTAHALPERLVHGHGLPGKAGHVAHAYHNLWTDGKCAEEVEVIFDYERSVDGAELESTVHGPDPESFVGDSKDDWALLRLREPQLARPLAPLADKAASEGESCRHHPAPEWYAQAGRPTPQLSHLCRRLSAPVSHRHVARLGHPCSIGPTHITPATISSVLVNGSIPAPLLLPRKIQACLRRSALLLSCFHPSRCAPRMKSLYRISDVRSRVVHISRQLQFLRLGRGTNHFRRESIWQSQKRQRRQMPQGNCGNLFNMLRGRSCSRTQVTRSKGGEVLATSHSMIA